MGRAVWPDSASQERPCPQALLPASWMTIHNVGRPPGRGATQTSRAGNSPPAGYDGQLEVELDRGWRRQRNRASTFDSVPAVVCAEPSHLACHAGVLPFGNWAGRKHIRGAKWWRDRQINQRRPGAAEGRGLADTAPRMLWRCNTSSSSALKTSSAGSGLAGGSPRPAAPASRSTSVS